MKNKTFQADKQKKIDWASIHSVLISLNLKTLHFNSKRKLQEDWEQVQGNMASRTWESKNVTLLYYFLEPTALL